MRPELDTNAQPILTTAKKTGPLAGVRVVDVSALGPGPFASMMLADFGADVISIRRPGVSPVFDPSEGMKRGKHSVAVDLKSDRGANFVRRLAANSDVFLESGRPGVMERLGLGPEALMPRNPKLVYARLTGWGQSGPYAGRAGHDINYLAIAGALGVSGEDRPVVPPALFGDISNGSYLAALGIVIALFDRVRTGLGQIVDASIMDGAAYSLAGIFHEQRNGIFDGALGGHVLSGTAPFYGTYRCADGRWYSVGAIEPQFYADLLRALGVNDIDMSPKAQWNRKAWPGLRERIASIFQTAGRDEWTDRFSGFDACVSPILDISELADDAHLAERRTVVVSNDGHFSSAPAPRLSNHPDLLTERSSNYTGHGSGIAEIWDLEENELGELLADGIVGI